MPGPGSLATAPSGSDKARLSAQAMCSTRTQTGQLLSSSGDCQVTCRSVGGFMAGGIKKRCAPQTMFAVCHLTTSLKCTCSVQL